MRRLREALEGARRGHGPAAFQPGDDGLGGSHRLIDLFLGHGGLAARLDDRRRAGEFVFGRLMGGDELRVFAPRRDGFFRAMVAGEGLEPPTRGL